MIPLITRADIQKYTGLSPNIEDKDIDPSIRDAQDFDVTPALPNALLAAIELNLIANIQQWNRNHTYSTGDKVFYNNKYYIAKGTTTDNIPPNTTYWDDLELMNFYLNSLQPYIVYAAFYRFAAYHGAQFTRAGLISMADATFNAVSDTQRGAILNDNRQKRDSCKLKMAKALSDANNTFDGVNYPTDTGECDTIKPGPRLYALGRRDLRNRYNKDDNTWRSLE